MKAAQYDKKKDAVVINDVPIPEPGEGQFLVKIKGASLCHSDLIMDIRPDGDTPYTMGHEGVGIIEKIHPSAEGKGFKVGDRIGMGYIINCCFQCEGCMVHNLACKNPNPGGPKVQGLMTDGFFAEYAACDWENAIILPDSLPIEKSSPLFCAGITAFHSVDSCDLKEGQWFAVVGCGGLGQFATQYAKAMGYKVIGIDVNDPMLEVAKQMGADATFNSLKNPNYVEEIKKLTDGGVHAAAVYSNATPAYQSATKVIRINGLLMVVGLPVKPLEFPAFDIVVNNYRIKGENTGIPQRMKKAVDFTAKHNIVPEVEFKKLEEMPQMVKDMDAGKASKRMVIVF
ncbi:alcohol dehydrogenase [Rhizodiscina lignyota]|uniref:Alcohol dehydrogenase n=1 Tax=Rhizodiscina lignyota TaxID=1504668 RepID=A0A9P4I8U6_9PEZI|nr:alcohol dehydrogenase [Rhizodiscina lignyota]